MAVTDSSAVSDGAGVFDRITSKEPEAAPAVAETVAEPQGETEAQAAATQAQRERDERGRFTAAQAAATEAAQTADAAQADPKAGIPSGRLREEAEGRRKAEAALEDFRKEADRRFQDFERRLAASQQPQRPAPEAPPAPDMYENPEGWKDHVFSEVERRFIKRRVDETFEDAREADTSTFDAAYSALTQAVQAGDLALRDKIVNAPNPGRQLVRWHKEQSALREVGGDVQGYQKRIREQALEEALRDPAFREKAMTAWRAEAMNPANGNRPSNVTDIPSLTRATGSGSSADDGDEPQGAAGVFQRISARR